MNDLRDWIKKVEEMGELLRLENADWNLEIGCIEEVVSQKAGKRPALLFDNIKDYPQGYRIVSNVLGSLSRLCLTAGFPINYKPVEFINRWRKVSKELKLTPPTYVPTGPVMENVITGKDIDLLKFPVPMVHHLDGGRYIATGTMSITKDPDEGWINVGTYRGQLIDKSSIGWYISPGKHAALQRAKYFDKGQPCPAVITLGQDPTLYLTSSMEIPWGVSEYDFTGGLQGKPVEVIEGKYTGLPIPATAEIALEGECLPGDMLPEGPFGEWPGYHASGSMPCPVFRVKAIYHRHDPILHVYVGHRPPAEHLYRSYIRSALLWDELEAAGVPEIKGVWCHEAGSTRLINIIAIKQRFAGHSRQAGLIASQVHSAAYMNRFTIVVDEDVDPFDTDAWLWAMATRCDPATNIVSIDRCWSSNLDPLVTPGQATFNSRAIIDACRPWERLKEFPKVTERTPEHKAEIIKKWGDKIFGIDKI